MKSTFVKLAILAVVSTAVQVHAQTCSDIFVTSKVEMVSPRGFQRFTAGPGAEINIRISKSESSIKIGDTLGKIDSGTFVGGALGHDFDLHGTKTNWDAKSGLLTVEGKSSSFDSTKYRLVLKVELSASNDPNDIRKITSAKLQSSNLGLFWKEEWKLDRALSRASTSIDRSDIRGKDVSEVLDVLDELGVPYDGMVAGSDYRGLYVVRESGYAGKRVLSFTGVETPSDMAGLLSGLRSLGLRADHPIFQRAPKDFQAR